MLIKFRCVAAVAGGFCRNLHHTTMPYLFPRLAGDWTCACGFSNFASRAVCFQCHRSKSVLPRDVNEPRAAMEAQQSSFRRGDWMCACGAHNFAWRDRCLSCEAPRKASDKQRQGSGLRLLPGDWICEKCKTHNFRVRGECMQCGWKPAVVNPAGTTSLRADSSAKQAPWTCLTCHTVNEKKTTSCEVCGSINGTFAAPSRPAAVSARRDDWHCDQCGFLNFSSRARCKNCGTLSAIASGATDPSLWICGCGYKNFRDRESCRDCGALKSSQP
ncbi:putative mitochondrial RNA binding complex 1 subunit [Trypanosoma cruzi]|uniref:RanBP2-type domain-containing protein n=2 Tax=Trypanosoma cruzi TaxID=5693 RepID=Q4DAM0_TRYCC|nr:hypothetical protein, conserved [Trypanosoma cruzi]EAN89567.1 hypothetical protein, conserved [Trypanosoma cruzi]PWV08073.1 putative mitochondrial RNA binding complex 1 subunit [Trypanosoma cruzi]RNC53074.1 hypothetical protein TcCL_ESM09628 [Trypanosoma cruzi]|eukprot:XP_811418.1 hypothetical protein [Trypanosoma cruzi strain CL Brener]